MAESPIDSLLHSQEPATCRTCKSNPVHSHPTDFWKILFNIILSSVLVSCKWCIFPRFSHQNTDPYVVRCLPSVLVSCKWCIFPRFSHQNQDPYVVRCLPSVLVSCKWFVFPTFFHQNPDPSAVCYLLLMYVLTVN